MDFAFFNDIGFNWDILLDDIGHVLLAFLLAFPIGWERGRGSHSVGFRTLPVVAMAACGFAIIIDINDAASMEARARVMQGVITGIGFIGGGAILKNNGNVKGLATAASVWNAGAIGLAIGFDRANIALVLSLLNLISLWILSPFKDCGNKDDSHE